MGAKDDLALEVERPGRQGRVVAALSLQRNGVAQLGRELARQQAYLMGNCAVNYLAWMAASVTGVALANAIPTAWGLGFAGILALLGVLSSLASSPLRIVSAGVAGAAAVAAWALPLKLNILVAIACAVALCLLLEHLRPAREGAGRV